MNKVNFLPNFFLIIYVMLFPFLSTAQEVPIVNYSTSPSGQVQLTVNSNSDKYYVLQVRHHPDSAFLHSTSLALGQNGTTIITEPLESYPQNHYKVLEYSISSPFDTDGDGLDDIAEYNNQPLQSPFNFGAAVSADNGYVSLNTVEAFNHVSVQQEIVPWIPYLNGKEFVKFIILNFYSTDPEIYFINTNTHDLHADFANFLGVDHLAPTVVKGQLIYHPNVLSSNGTLGTYAFNYTNNESEDFIDIQRTHELLASNAAFITNNLSYYITENNEYDYFANETLFQNSRVPVLFETDVYAGINYWGLNQTEGYGFFRQMNLTDVPGPKDIVLYSAIPNSLPRVGGVITSVIQTPLSHVNLRAIQDNIPNAFIRDPLDNDTIASLLNHYIYLKVEQSGYTIREATLDEVNAWYEKNRPKEIQAPPLNLDYTKIEPLDNITFEMFDGFGAKVANVATMRKFDFPVGTIPDGYGIPFYYYREFMKYNNFFEDMKVMISNPDFQSDRLIRDARLAEFREKLENGNMPTWMMTDLGILQKSFPFGTSIRCRSSTNNEDLPGFSGAGLYESKTQHPNEGHISKSIKQVFASLWNLRAFEEREFYRIDHFYTSMGVLCHANYDDEKVNGVGVSADPIYGTENTFYVNSQLGSELITNPGNESYPEELLLSRYPVIEDDFSVVQYSSLLPEDSLLMTSNQIKTLRYYLAIVHDQFAFLYNAVDNPTFAMDIEYKINTTGQLIIKQARPWVEYEYVPVDMQAEACNMLLFPNPSSEFLNVTCDECDLSSLVISDLQGNSVLEKLANVSGSDNMRIDVSEVPSGMYIISGYWGNKKCSSKRYIKH